MAEPIPHIKAITGSEPVYYGETPIQTLMSLQQVDGTNALPAKPNERTPGGRGN